MAGASGLIGTYLTGFLNEYDLLKISRHDFQLNDQAFADKYKGADIIINMSGAPVIKRWNKRNRKEILNSRILTTRKLGSIMDLHPEKERFYLSGSAIGIYDDKVIHSEASSAWGQGFMTEIVQKWEAEVHKLKSSKIKVCILRTGVVLAAEGGMIARLLPIFSIGLGARIGKGKQYFSWIHIEDLARAIVFLIEKESEGIYNMTAPGFCSNKEFTASLGLKLGKPARLMIPKILFMLIYGRAAAIVTGGQAVIPERLTKDGFCFTYPYIDQALEDIVN